MNAEPSGIEILFLWRLAAGGGSGFKTEVRPDLEMSARKRLLSAGLVETEMKKPPGGKQKQLHFSLTDRGWQWLSEHLDATLTTRSPATLDVLVRLLARLKSHLDVLR